MGLRRLFQPTALLACLGLLSLAACGGGSGDEHSAGPSPSDCHYRYALTDSLQQVGPDPLIGRQWHLENRGQSGGTPGEDLGARASWAAGARGAGIQVAVIDDAVETTHPDLAPNLARNALWDYRTRTATAPMPCLIDDDHGTAVAGVILARDDNGFQGAGVAPRASLAAYNALATSTDADIADALTRDLADNAIYNNSWGSPDNGMLNRAETSFGAAIREGLARGRHGLGAIYVFPGGNGGCYLRDENDACSPEENDARDGYLNRENANYDGYTNQLGIIATCAVDDEGKAPYYAEPGANLLVCGPSGNRYSAIGTTDVQGGFRENFSGTSASTPMVAGAAALVLSARPDLSWRDLRLILAYSARQNDPAHPDWALQGARPFNPYYGFGAVDAEAAVHLARNWSSVGGSESLVACPPEGEPPYSRGAANGPFPIHLGDAPSSGPPQTRDDTITVGADCGISHIEFVEVGFTASHPFSGDLRIDLISPRNQVSRLADARWCDPDRDGMADNCGHYDDWRFGSVRHLDEDASGQWRLQVSDQLPGATGQWQAWTLRIWGR